MIDNIFWYTGFSFWALIAICVLYFLFIAAYDNLKIVRDLYDIVSFPHHYYRVSKMNNKKLNFLKNSLKRSKGITASLFIRIIEKRLN